MTPSGIEPAAFRFVAQHPISFQDQAPPMTHAFAINLVLRIVNDQTHYKQIDCRLKSHQISPM